MTRPSFVTPAWWGCAFKDPRLTQATQSRRRLCFCKYMQPCFQEQNGSFQSHLFRWWGSVTVLLELEVNTADLDKKKFVWNNYLHNIWGRWQVRIWRNVTDFEMESYSCWKTYEKEKKSTQIITKNIRYQFLSIWYFFNDIIRYSENNR